MIDCHWHPTAYEKEVIKEKIEKAHENGIKKLVGVPLDFNSNETLLKISKEFESIYPTIGIHPQYATNTSQENIEKICSLLETPQTIAAGEIGIDLHFLDKKTKKKQLEVFRKLLDKAVKEKLPVILHCPRGEPITFKEVQEANAEKVVFHWYTGPHEILRKIISTKNYFISVTPAVFYSGKLQKIVKLTNLEKILVESDGPTNYRSDIGTGTPSQIPQVLEKIANIKEEPLDKVKKITTKNAEKFFNL